MNDTIVPSTECISSNGRKCLVSNSILVIPLCTKKADIIFSHAYNDPQLYNGDVGLTLPYTFRLSFNFICKILLLNSPS